MSVPTVCAGDVIVDVECFADADSNRLFPAIEMRQSRHQRAGIEFVDLLLEETNPHHLPIRLQPLLFLGESASAGFGLGCSHGHCRLPPDVPGVVTPDVAAKTANMQANSSFVQPMPR